MQLRVFANFTQAELDAMSDDEWELQLCHLAAVRQAQKNESLNEAIAFENLKRGVGP